MLHGLIINGVDTLEKWGLCLLADYTISPAELVENYIEIPGANGSLDLSNYPQGYPVYRDRKITGNLFAGLSARNLELARDDLVNAYHGKTVNLIFPQDIQDFYPQKTGVNRYDAMFYRGRFMIGEMANYNSGIVPFSMTASPFKQKTYPLSWQKQVASNAATLYCYNPYLPGNFYISQYDEATGASVNVTGTTALSTDGVTFRSVSPGSAAALLQHGPNWVRFSQPGAPRKLVVTLSDVRSL